LNGKYSVPKRYAGFFADVEQGGFVSTALVDSLEKHAIRDGMRLIWDAPIKMDDGVAMRADVRSRRYRSARLLVAVFRQCAV